MTTPREPDSILAAWLEEGPTELPETTRRAISVATRTTEQKRRSSWASWRAPQMTPLARVAVAAVAVVALAGGTAYLLGSTASVGGPSPALAPSPGSMPPSPAPQGAVPTDWTTYSTSRFAYSIDYPSDWTVTPATTDWLIGGLSPYGSNLDRFGLTPTGTRVLVSSTPITDAMTSADRVAQLDSINAACELSDRHSITIDGATARQEDFFCFGVDYGIEVVVANGNRHYQIDLFSQTPIGETDRATFDRFLASFHFPAPAMAWQTFVSERFAYTVDLPGEWEITTPADDLPDHLYPGPEADYADRWDPPVTRNPWFIVAAIDPAPEETTEEWVARYNADLGNACSALVPEPIEVDGETGTLRAGACLLPGVDLVDVLVVHGGRAYTITIAGASRDTTANRAIFDQILASFRFTN